MRTLLILAAVAVVGCARGSDEMPADSPAAAMAVPLTYGELAGRWSLQFVAETSDSVLATYDLMATTDASAWTLSPPGKEPIPLRVAVDSDSLLIDAGPYKSDTPKPVDMTTHAVGRIEGGMLVGTYVSQFAVQTADSIVRGRIRGTRLP